MMTKGRLGLLVVVATLAGIFFTLGLGHYLSLDYLKAEHAQLVQYLF